MILKNKILHFLALGFLLSMCSCLDFVEDGIEIEYADSDATLTITPIGSTSAPMNETVSLSIAVSSDFDIKSCIISTTNEGKNGSGFNVSDNSFDDPFSDHNFGTVRPGIKSFTVRYDYIVPEEINKSRITVTVIDESGRVRKEETINVVPAISRTSDLELYAKNTIFHDALAVSEGIVYEDIKSNYSTFTSENVEVQKKIDVVFYYNPDNQSTSIVAPASTRLDYELSIENKMVFKKIQFPAGLDFDNLSAADLADLAEQEKLNEEGSLQLDGITVGDMIGFIADINAINSFKAGILRVEALHPASVARYEGISYVMKCSIIVQN